ncbi:MAG: hypothetical protein PVH60_00560 [Anaerolineales bacterium]
MEKELRNSEKQMPFSPAVGCLISFLLAAIPVCLIMGVFVLAVRNEIVLSLGPVREVRLWFVTEGQEQGLGISTMEKVSGEEDLGEVCYRSNVHFLLWRSLDIERQSLYCECYDLKDGVWGFVGDCPE